MTRQIAALLQVKPGEGRLVALLVALMFLPAMGGAIGTPGAEALFFSRFGVAYLPPLYIALAAVTLLTSFVIAALLGRLPRRLLYLGLPAAMALGLLAARVVVAWNVRWFYPVLWLGSYLSWTLQALVTWGLAGSLCNTRQAKRLFPLLGAGSILGLAAGGLVTPALVTLLGTGNLLLVWAAALLAELGLVQALAQRLPAAAQPRRPARRRPGWQRGMAEVRRSPLLRWTALAALLLSLLWYAVAFPFSQAVAARFTSLDSLTGFLGLFQGATNAFALGASLLFANRLYARFGLMAASLALAALYLAGFGLLLILGRLPGLDLFAALVAFRFAQLVWHLGVTVTAFQAVFNVVPDPNREQTRAFIDGVPVQAGLALVGLGLMTAGPALRPWHLHLAGALAAAAALVALVRANRAYRAALAQALRAGQPHLFFDDEAQFGGYPHDAAAVATVLRGASDPDPRVRRVAIEILGHLPAAAAADALVTALGDPDLEVRHAALRALPAATAESALLEIVPFAQAPEPETRLLAIEALRGLARYPRGLAHVLRPLLADPHPAVRGRAAAVILTSQPDPAAATALRAMTSDPDPPTRALALQALADWGDRGNYDLAARALEDPSPPVRRAAILALPHIDRERCLVPLAEALGDDHSEVRAAAAEALAGAGPAALPVLAGALAHPAREDAALRALAARPGDPPVDDLRDYARTKVSLARQYAGWQADVKSLAHGTERLDLLARALGEAARAQALWAVRAVGQMSPALDHTLVVDALASPDSAQRANALEMIEGWPAGSLLHPLFPVLEGDGLAATTREPAPSPASLTAVLTPILYDVNAWLRACAALAAAGTTEPSLQGQLKRLRDSDPHPIVRDTAAKSLAHLEGETPMDTLATISLLDRVVFLQRVRLFQNLTTPDLSAIAVITEERYYPAGDVIARQGDPGDELFIIVTGTVQVLDESPGRRPTEVVRRGPGDYVGEMAILSREPRMATLVALESVRLLCIGQPTFEAILRERPDISLAVMRDLCQRLRVARAAGHSLDT